MSINDPSTLTACYEASMVPLSDFSQLSDIFRNSDLSRATAPSVCILNWEAETMMTPSQFWTRYAVGKVIPYLGHNVDFSAPINFDMEPAEIMSTQSPIESTVLSLVTPDSHVHQSEPTMVDLTMDQTTPDLFVDTLLPKFDAVSNNCDEECRRLQVELQNVQSTLDHLRAYASQQEGRPASDLNTAQAEVHRV